MMNNAKANEYLNYVLYSMRAKTLAVPIGISLLSALEENDIPVIAACRTGIYDSCKTKVLQGEYETTTTGPLTPQDIQQGYVLACSCQIKGNINIEPVI